MANRIIEQLNIIRSNAPLIGEFYSKRYLRGGSRNVSAASIQRAHEGTVNMYFRVGGYDLYESQESNYAKDFEFYKYASLFSIRHTFINVDFLKKYIKYTSI